MKDVAGVLETEVDGATKTATCTVDPATFKAEEAIAALKAKKFPNAAVKSDG